MVMRFDGEKAILTYKEQVAARLPSPIPIDEIDMIMVFGALARDQYALRERMMADDHESTHWERPSISPDEARLQRHRETLVEMAGQLTVHKAEIFLSAQRAQ